MTSVDPTKRLTTLVQMRTKTDVVVGEQWILFAISSYVLWTALAVILLTRVFRMLLGLDFILGIFGTLGFVASVGLSYLTYSLINRQNKHATREQELFWEALNQARSQTSQDDMKVLIPLSSAEGDFSKLLQKTHERSAVLWALLALIPYAGWIFLVMALYLLSQDSNAHEQSERLFLEDIDRTLGALASKSLPPKSVPQYPKNSLGYAIASVLTLGVFSLFWLHKMVKEPEAHFGYHASFEPSLLEAFPGTDTGTRSMI